MRYFRLLVLALLLVALTPTVAGAYPKAVERWRPVLRAQIAAQKIPAAQAKRLEAVGMRIIHRETGGTGSPTIRNRSGHTGLFQYSRSWVRRSKTDWRKNPSTSCYVFVRTYRQAGWKGIRRHWGQTCGRI